MRKDEGYTDGLAHTTKPTSAARAVVGAFCRATVQPKKPALPNRKAKPLQTASFRVRPVASVWITRFEDKHKAGCRNSLQDHQSEETS
jgi:hypothetical protein